VRKEPNMSKRRMAFLAAVAIPLFIAFIAIGGEVVLLLWNWLLPPIFGWRELTYWQALGILALSRILFGGLGGFPRSNNRRTTADRWERLTPEERERFRQGTRGLGASTSESKGP
jgi:hypothetical protein